MYRWREIETARQASFLLCYCSFQSCEVLFFLVAERLLFRFWWKARSFINLFNSHRCFKAPVVLLLEMAFHIFCFCIPMTLL